MRTTMWFTSLAMALSLGAGVAAAQAPAQQPAQAGQMARMRGRRGPDAMLLRGITLNADQQARVAALRKQWNAQRQAERQQRQNDGQAAQPNARGQRGQWSPEQRAAMQRQRDQQIASLRAILTPAQQRQLDANVAKMKQRFDRRAENGQRPNGQGGFGDR